MYDNVMVSYKPLGDEFLGKVCQTKGLNCFMSKYWLSPAGELFEVNCQDAFDMEINEEPIEEGKIRIPFFKWIKNGNHGWVRPVYRTCELKIYPETFKGSYEDWPEAKLHLLYGRIISYSFTHKGEHRWQTKESRYSIANQLIQDINHNSLANH